jgi:hypothetical protein
MKKILSFLGEVLGLALGTAAFIGVLFLISYQREQVYKPLREDCAKRGGSFDPGSSRAVPDGLSILPHCIDPKS